MYVWAIWAPNIKNESIVAFLPYLIAKKLCFKKQNKKTLPLEKQMLNQL